MKGKEIKNFICNTHLTENYEKKSKYERKSINNAEFHKSQPKVFLIRLSNEKLDFAFAELRNLLPSDAIFLNLSKDVAESTHSSKEMKISSPFVLVLTKSVEMLQNAVFVKSIGIALFFQSQAGPEQIISNYFPPDRTETEKQIETHSTSVPSGNEEPLWYKQTQKDLFEVLKDRKFIKNVDNILRFCKKSHRFEKGISDLSFAGRISTHKTQYRKRNEFFNSLETIIFGQTDLKNPDIVYELIETSDETFLVIDITRSQRERLELMLPKTGDSESFRQLILSLQIKDRLFIGRTCMDTELSCFMYNMTRIRNGEINGKDLIQKSETHRTARNWPMNPFATKFQRFSFDFNHVVYDPFVGSGGLLLIPSILGSNVIGTDINRNEMVGYLDYDPECHKSKKQEKFLNEKMKRASITENHFTRDDSNGFKSLKNNLNDNLKNNPILEKDSLIGSLINTRRVKKCCVDWLFDQINSGVSDFVKLHDSFKTHKHESELFNFKNHIFSENYEPNQKFSLKEPLPLLFIPQLDGTRTILRNTNILSNFYQYNSEIRVLGIYEKDINTVNREILRKKNFIDERSGDDLNDEKPLEENCGQKNKEVLSSNEYCEEEIDKNRQAFLYSTKFKDLKTTNFSIITDLPYGTRIPLANPQSDSLSLLESLYVLSVSLLKKTERICFCTADGRENGQEKVIESKFAQQFTLIFRGRETTGRCKRVFYVWERK